MMDFYNKMTRFQIWLQRMVEKCIIAVTDAIRHEIKTEEKVGGKSHIQKGLERLKNLENILNKQQINNSDKSIVQGLIDDLKNALGGK